MIAQNLHEESHFEILSVFTAHFSGILKDWWISLGDTDKMTFLTRQDFSENINILYLMFIGDVKESRETWTKETRLTLYQGTFLKNKKEKTLKFYSSSDLTIKNVDTWCLFIAFYFIHHLTCYQERWHLRLIYSLLQDSKT